MINRRQSNAVEPEELDAWFARKTPAQPTMPDLNQRFKEVTDTIDAKLNKFQQSLELMVHLLDERLNSFEARLPPIQPAKPVTQAKRHEKPLFTSPP